jgi:hypothetical protein
MAQLEPGGIAIVDSRRLMRRLVVPRRAGVVLALAACVATGFAASADAVARAEQHRVGINAFMIGGSRSGARGAVRSGEVKSLRFAFGIDLISEHHNGSDTTETVRLTLPAGLAWGDGPGEAKTLFPNGVPSRWTFEAVSESCTVEGRTAVCTATGVPSGTQLFGWLLDVVASSAGTYEIAAELTPADGFMRPSGRLNGRAILTVLVGAPKLVIETPRIARTDRRPSIVQVVVPMTSGGGPVSPTAGRFRLERCVFRMANDQGYGEREGPGIVGPGFVRCAVGFNNTRYRGSTLIGEIHLRVAGRLVVRKFSVKLGSGSRLSSPVGAVVETGRPNTKESPVR